MIIARHNGDCNTRRDAGRPVVGGGAFVLAAWSSASATHGA